VCGGEVHAPAHVLLSRPRSAQLDVGEAAVQVRLREQLRVGRAGLVDSLEHRDGVFVDVECRAGIACPEQDQRMLVVDQPTESEPLCVVRYRADQVTRGGEVDESVCDGAGLGLGVGQCLQDPDPQCDRVGAADADRQREQCLTQELDALGRTTQVARVDAALQ
jgi:hypothetical protein